MIVEEKTREELISEILELQRRVSELERSDTECRRAQEALREERDRAQNYLDVAGVMFLVIDADERVSLINKKGCDILGCEQEEIVGTNWFDNFVPERIREETRMVFMALMAGEIEPVEYHENPVLAKNGEERIIAFHNTILRDETGKATATLSSGEDITEHRRVEVALRESENKFRDLAEKSFVGVYLVQDGVLEYANPRLAEIFGYEVQELVEKKLVKDLVFPEDWPIVEENIRKRISGEVKSVHHEVRGVTKDEKTIYVEVYGSRTMHQGRPAVVGSLLDITERKLAEQALYLSEEKYRTMIEHCNDMIWTLDTEGNFTFFNKRAEEISGYGLGDWRGKTFAPLIVEEDLPRVIEVFQKTLKGEPQHYEVRVKKPDGDIFILSVNTAPIYENNEVVGTVSFGRDITDYKQAEKELRNLMQTYADSVKEWQQTFDATLDIIALLSPDFEILKINKAGCEAIGKKQEELIGKKCYEVIHGLDHPIEGCPCVKTIQTKIAESAEIADRGRSYMATTSPVLDEDNKPTAFVYTVRDITERKQVEERLRMEAELLDAASDSIMLTGLDGNIVYVNEAAYKSRGYSKDELMSINVHDLDAPECAELLGPRIGRLMEVGEVNYECTHICKDGSLMPNEVRARIIDSGGRRFILSVFRNIAERKQTERELQDTLKKLREALRGIIQVVALTVELKDPYTAGHQKRVANLARAIAQEMGLSKDQVDGIRIAGIIHDVGKVSVPTEILSKPGKITEIEMAMIKTHPKVGYEILKDIEFPWPLAEMVLQHHERMDGSGYPLGVSGEDILLEARILGVADVVEAMASHRPYRPALGTDDAIEEITRNRGILYDADVVDACARLLTEKGFKFEEVKEALVT